MEQSQVARLLYAIEHGHVAILAAMFDLSKRVVVLTGATGNIGPTVLRAYLGQGGHVPIPVRDEDNGATLRDSLGDLAGAPDDPRVFVRPAVPGDRAPMEGFVEEVLRAWGRLDVVANLIGGYASSDAAAGDLAAYRALSGERWRLP
jgi:NAD(P)-dependent dehydrogenase (short-subunit alcohol dehydrogenase family)